MKAYYLVLEESSKNLNQIHFQYVGMESESKQNIYSGKTIIDNVIKKTNQRL